MSKYYLDQEQYASLARQAAAEGCVLLKNDNSTLPLKEGDRVAVFGRIAHTYYKSGLGSGGLVNTRYVVGISSCCLYMRNGSQSTPTMRGQAGGGCPGARRRCLLRLRWCRLPQTAVMWLWWWWDVPPGRIRTTKRSLEAGI